MSANPLTIALLGAESTGKTQLALALAEHLRAVGRTVTVVPEVLREWCDQRGRTPQPQEQQAIAEEQARRVLTAQAGMLRDSSTPDAQVTLATSVAHAAHVVIADTTPLMTAVYSDKLFQDRSLYPFAMAHHRAYSQTLLTGLDLPWVADGLQRDSPAVQAPVDAMVRSALQAAGIPFHVVYGEGDARLRNALSALRLDIPITMKSVANSGDAIRARGPKDTEPDAATTRWVWACDKCSDPACEHRLFTGLQRSMAAGYLPP